MREGVRLCLDLGSKRIGVARSDANGRLALPVTVLDAETDWLAAFRQLLDEQPVLEIVVGLPVSLRGTEELAAIRVREQLALVRAAAPSVPVRLVDERLSSAGAHRQLRAAGHSTRSARTVIDAAAATEVLEFALEYERRTGTPAGETA